MHPEPAKTSLGILQTALCPGRGKFELRTYKIYLMPQLNRYFSFEDIPTFLTFFNQISFSTTNSDPMRRVAYRLYIVIAVKLILVLLISIGSPQSWLAYKCRHHKYDLRDGA